MFKACVYQHVHLQSHLRLIIFHWCLIFSTFYEFRLQCQSTYAVYFWWHGCVVKVFKSCYVSADPPRTSRTFVGGEDIFEEPQFSRYKIQKKIYQRTSTYFFWPDATSNTDSYRQCLGVIHEKIHFEIQWNILFLDISPFFVLIHSTFHVCLILK